MVRRKKTRKGSLLLMAHKVRKKITRQKQGIAFFVGAVPDLPFHDDCLLGTYYPVVLERHFTGKGQRGHLNQVFLGIKDLKTGHQQGRCGNDDLLFHFYLVLLRQRWGWPERAGKRVLHDNIYVFLEY